MRQLIDADEIRRLKYTYCRAADALDAEGMLAVLTDDCVVDLSGGRGGAVSGIDAARKLYSCALSKYAASSHYLSNMDVVFESADTARLESYLYAWQRYQLYPEVRGRHRWARYRDVFRRDADDGSSHIWSSMSVARSHRKKSSDPAKRPGCSSGGDRTCEAGKTESSRP